VTTINDDLQQEVDEFVQSAEARLDSIGRRVTAEDADRAIGYTQAAADIGRGIFEALDPVAQARLLERVASITTNLETLSGTGSFAGGLNESLQDCRRALADPTVEERHAVALVLLAKNSVELGGVCPACASERQQRALDLDSDEQRCRMIAARVEANWPTDVDPMCVVIAASGTRTTSFRWVMARTRKSGCTGNASICTARR
jgi:hypothetical protein